LWTPVDYALEDIYGARATYTQGKRRILLNTYYDSDTTRRTSYHEFGEVIIEQYGWRDYFSNPQLKEYCVNYLAYLILCRLDPEEAVAYGREEMGREVPNNQEERGTAEQVAGSILRVLQEIESLGVRNEAEESASSSAALEGLSPSCGSLYKEGTVPDFKNVSSSGRGHPSDWLKGCPCFGSKGVPIEWASSPAGPADLAQMLKEQVDFWLNKAQEKNITVVIDTPEHLLIIGRKSNWGLESNVIGELILNAITYTPYGGTIRVSLRQEGSMAILEVNDTGIGIAPLDIDKIFYGHYRGANAKAIKEDGTGLGLREARMTLYDYKGNISVSPGLDQGSTFIVRLPLFLSLTPSSTSSSPLAVERGIFSIFPRRDTFHGATSNSFDGRCPVTVGAAVATRITSNVFPYLPMALPPRRRVWR